MGRWQHEQLHSTSKRCGSWRDGGQPVGCEPAHTAADAVCQIAALEPGAGVVDFYADSAVSADAVFVVEVTG